MKKVIITIIIIFILGIIGLFIFYNINNSSLDINFNEEFIETVQEQTDNEENYENYIEEMEQSLAQQIINLDAESKQIEEELLPQSYKNYNNAIIDLEKKGIMDLYEKGIYFDLFNTLTTNSSSWGLGYDGTQTHYSTIKPYITDNFIEKFKDNKNGIIDDNIIFDEIIDVNFILNNLTLDINYIKDNNKNKLKYKVNWIYEKNPYGNNSFYRINDIELIFDTGDVFNTPIYLDNATEYILRLLQQGYKTTFDIYKYKSEAVSEDYKLNQELKYGASETILEKYPNCKILSDSISEDSEIIDFIDWTEETDDTNWDRDYIKLALQIKDSDNEVYTYYYIFNYKRGYNCSLESIDYLMKKKVKSVVKETQSEEEINEDTENIEELIGEES